MTDVLPERVARMQSMGATHAHCTAGLPVTALAASKNANVMKIMLTV